MNQADITVDECIELATTAKAMAPKQPHCWDDLIDLSTSLEMATEAERLLKGSGWLPEVLRRSGLAALDSDIAAEGQGASSEEALGAANIDVEIDLPAFLVADLPVESPALMAAE
jgi:ParB family transcriptional regulator, chromosome partitioning protein